MNGDVDTRRQMTRADFEAAADYAYENWWLTGEDHFIHVAPVKQVEGWNIYGHSGNAQLTEPQRVLMMWSDLVGQTQNGGFTQFIDNFAASLKLTHRLISQIGWLDLFERFDRAFREQAGDPETPQPPPTGIYDPAHWPAGRSKLLRHLARKRLGWWQRVTPAHITDLENIIPGWRLQLMYRDAVAAGEIEPLPTIPPRSTTAAEAFDSWFYSAQTKEDSKLHIGAYIRKHRDGLCRMTD
jgi:hypothetical protein